jgi:BASS family bile acid:Na+ symporter
MRAVVLCVSILATATYGFSPSMVVRASEIPRAPISMVKKPTLPLFKRGGGVKKATAIEVSGGENPAGGGGNLISELSGKFVNLFPVWTALFAGAALYNPNLFLWLTTEYFTAGLALLMLSMGITLTPKDFADVFSEDLPAVITQWAGCYVMMPLLALGLGKLFGLGPELIAGMVLVGCINGGQASNLCTYIAKGNVALSVIMTTATTISAIFMTPLLCKTLLGAIVPVNAQGIAVSTIQVVLAPILAGMTLNKYSPKTVEKVLPVAPLLGVFSTIFLVASAVAQVRDPIMNAGLMLQIPVLLLHLVGGLVGYCWPKYIGGFDETTSRTMAIETSMKSSAFGFLLAKLHFSTFLTRVPSAVSVVWMAVTGSTLAVIWKYIPVADKK